MPAQLLPYGAIALFAVALIGLFAWGWRARGRRAAPQRVAGKDAATMLSIQDAADAAYETAKKERMAIVWAAENAKDHESPIAWFAQSIASVVPVYCKSERDGFEKVGAVANVVAEMQSLYIRKQSYRTYLDWARSLQ
jgi:hypothetical protein